MLQISAHSLVEVDHLATVDARVDVSPGSANRACALMSCWRRSAGKIGARSGRRHGRAAGVVGWEMANT
jgi:hypothetical protein